jgi:hypothetical protein
LHFRVAKLTGSQNPAAASQDIPHAFFQRQNKGMEEGILFLRLSLGIEENKHESISSDRQ